jgi:ATP-dependent Clp protease ATP-binding subunit ClpX
VGEDVESVLFKLYMEAGQDVEQTERGIIYIDEIDKVCSSSTSTRSTRYVSALGGSGRTYRWPRMIVPRD